MSEQQGNSEHETHALFQQRWSPRGFDSDKKVLKQDLLRCLEAARWAPSCFGDEPWRFIVCQREESEQHWQNLLSCLMPKNQSWAKSAPVLILTCTHTVFKHNGNENRWAEYDAGAASVSLSLQAADLGLVTHQMGGFDADAVRKTFAIPNDYMPMAVMALGYQGNGANLDEGFQGIEQTERKRRAIKEISFFDGWKESE